MKKNQKIFISGPMTGYRNYNRDCFNSYEKLLKISNFQVVNPINISKKYYPNSVVGEDVDRNSKTFKTMTQELLNELKTCDCILLLDGWENSVGAKVELLYALQLNKKILTEKDFKK